MRPAVLWAIIACAAGHPALGPHKAFAVSPNGAFGYRAGVRSAADALTAALAGCARHARDCILYAIDNERVKAGSAGSL